MKSSAAAEDDIAGLCPQIQKGFMDGMMSFQFDDQKGKFLADNGFAGKESDVSIFHVFVAKYLETRWSQS